MGFLRRVLGRPKSAVPTSGVPGLVHLVGPIVIGPQDRLYAMATCPYCGVGLDPLPSRRRKCPACTQEIVYGVTPDGIRILHRIDDDLGLAAEIAEHWAASSEYGAQLPVRPGRLREVHQRQLGRAAALGLSVRYRVGDEDPRTCGPCKDLGGRAYAANVAPALPYDRCRSRYVCNCRAELVLS